MLRDAGVGTVCALAVCDASSRQIRKDPESECRMQRAGGRISSRMAYKLIATVRGGSTNSALTAKRFSTVEEARAGAK